MIEKKINIITLGCSKNIVDSEKLLGQLKAGGWSIMHNAPDDAAETVVINTCGFINDAKEESIDTILRLIRQKEKGRISRVYVMGCLSERYKTELQKEIKEVDKYFGVNNFNDILSELELKPDESLRNERIVTSPGHYAYLKVAEGCDRTCSFCAIPAIRGRYISKPSDELTEEARKLALAGVRELILVAQDLSYYGLDSNRKQLLPGLVSRLAELKLFEWIRLHYLYPANFPYDLIKVIKDHPELCRYIDLPVQHISDKMLSAMRRSHSRSDTYNILEKIRKELPEAAIRTTLIVGHPGETQAEYEELKDFVRNFRFERLGVFKYSHEEGTYSYLNFSDEIPENVKESRVSELMAIQQEISGTLNSAHIGKEMKVLIDSAEGSYYTGRTEFDSPEIDQEVLIPIKYGLTPGNFHNIRISGNNEFDLFGEPAH
jgi:ribosomal protein S12 methylthiotransferase